MHRRKWVGYSIQIKREMKDYQDGAATRDIWEEGKTVLSTYHMGAKIAEQIIDRK